MGRQHPSPTNANESRALWLDFLTKLTQLHVLRESVSATLVLCRQMLGAQPRSGLRPGSCISLHFESFVLSSHTILQCRRMGKRGCWSHSDDAYEGRSTPKSWGWDLEGPSHKVTRSWRVSRGGRALDLRWSARCKDEGRRKVTYRVAADFPIWRVAPRELVFTKNYLAVCLQWGFESKVVTTEA
ncbi:hypothetical protein BDM02DRAFT_909486 [Thelephora ganbajun]|uniref:Uncharacterized protein n=1 Tax=Thelephora ganbajun TaxID=370292 RepID=A0ACB6ZNZ4_THEGA|nr:hypothetical protein BDM02DRAFT_909486 [Thelephora ganbajun]